MKNIDYFPIQIDHFEYDEFAIAGFSKMSVSSIHLDTKAPNLYSISGFQSLLKQGGTTYERIQKTSNYLCSITSTILT
jgi:hypothetical protein